jgi:hypothetical protein
MIKFKFKLCIIDDEHETSNIKVQEVLLTVMIILSKTTIKFKTVKFDF